MIPWTDVQKALRSWVVSGSGLDEGHVIWAGQEGPRPNGTYISMNIINVQRFGQDWVNVEDNPGGGPGEEILHKARGQRFASLSLQCFDGEPVGELSSSAILSSVMLKASLPNIHSTLVAAGVGITSFGQIGSIVGSVGSVIVDPRATLDVVVSLAAEVTEPGTYIESVEITDNEGNTFIVES